MNGSPRAMPIDELRHRLAAGSPVTVLDIRTAADRAEWWIPESLHADACDDLKRGDATPLEHLDLPGTAPVVTVCRAGVVARAAAAYFAAHGHQAFYLEGGMNGWSQAWNHAEVPMTEPDLAIIQVRRTGKGCLSYLIGSNGEAAIIDASVDPGVYLRLAEERRWRITAVLDTHIHADHLSRGRALAEQTGARLFLPAQQRARFAFQPLHDGEQVRIGSATITAFATPGHTPESTSYRLNDGVLFTGDTLFLGAVGRPDLEASGEAALLRARLLHASLTRILTLPDATLILPGHTDRPVPFDGRPLSDTLGELREGNAPLARWFSGAAPTRPEDFVEWVLGRLPATPANHQESVRLNEAGAPRPGNLEGLEAGANRCAVS